MSFIEGIKAKAKTKKMKIVLPESYEERNLRAADKIMKEGLADIILVGNPKEILELEVSKDLDLDKAEIIDPSNYDGMDDFVDTLVELRKKKGMTPEQARETLMDPVYFGVMLLKKNIAHGLVSGAIHATADILRPALQIIKTAPNTKLVSAAFIMDVPNCEFGNNGIFVFADTALNPNPTSEELANIALSSADTYRALIQEEPIVAMLSFSTYGSAKHADVDKVNNATKLAKELAPNLKLDGEMQFDAAIVPAVGSLKAPESDVAGKANVLVFPDLDAANIGYKIAQRLAKAEAYGPITQGIAKPLNDLSRGCSVEDIIGTVAITAVQAQMAEK